MGRILEKGIHSKVNETQGVSVLGAFKLDHLQPVRMILFEKLSSFLGAPISYYPRERQKGKGASTAFFLSDH